MLKRLHLFAAEEQARGGRAWWWGLQLGVVAGLILWWYLKNRPEIERRKRAIQQDLSPEPQGEIPLPDEPLAGMAELETRPAAAAAAPEVAPAPLQAEDLKRIEGIGPKIAKTLQQAGIMRFEQLAGLQPEAIKAILDEGGVRLAYPDTWPEQAALAAREDWDGLAALQSTLKAGRRI
ncbi:MAG: hypothetical protein JW862_13675 [Anaerolineales bacterium]|nr:hypothetical protein [Anaerolineales bacterium]